MDETKAPEQAQPTETSPKAEQVQSLDNDIEKMRDSLKNANSEAKQNRLKAKELQEKLDAIEAERAESERKLMEEQGEFKKLYESINGEKTALQQKIAELEPIVENYKKELELKKTELLAKLPDDLKAVGEKLGLEDLGVLVSKSSSTSNTSQGVANNTKPENKDAPKSSKFMIIN